MPTEIFGMKVADTGQTYSEKPLRVEKCHLIDVYCQHLGNQLLPSLITAPRRK